jgi:hypothetical protein
VSPLVSILLLFTALGLVGVAIFLDHAGHTRAAVGAVLAGLFVFAVMLCTSGSVEWGMQPEPAPTPSPTRTGAPVPSYDPEKCIELQWLDRRWTCIPRDEAG